MLDGSTSSYNAVSCGGWLFGLIPIPNFFLTQYYVTINVTIAVTVSVMLKVNVNVIIATAPVGNESEPNNIWKNQRYGS